MVERCVRCNVNGDEVRLFDAIYEGRMGSLCERCSIIENILIIKRPEISQLKESEEGAGVYSRMKRLSGIKDSKKDETFFIEDRLNELNENPNLEVPEKDQLNLIEHFHWEIMKNRRRKGLSHKQLAEALGESEIVIQMVEKAKFPENAEYLIKKLEQFFQIKLKKVTDTDRFLSRGKKEPILLDEDGRELMEIPEPEIKQPEIKEVEEVPKVEETEIVRKDEGDSVGEFLEKESASLLKNEDVQIEEFGEHEIRELPDKEEIDLSESEERDLSGIDIEKGEFDITRANLSEVKISDLKELNRKKIEATKKEQIEEQKRIEERNRMIEARKEELRLMKEDESKELDDVLGGTELLDVGETIKSVEDSEKVVEFEDELI